MILTLEVTAAQAAQLGPASRKTFRATGGVIGRDRNSDWVLPNSEVSGRHARISCVGTAFYIEDTSSLNGVFLNSTTNPLAPGRPHRLKSGDRILIKPYDIQVTITTEPSDAARTPAPERLPERSPASELGGRRSFDPDDPFGQAFPSPPPTPPRGMGRLDAHAEPLPDEELDPLKLLNATTPKRQPARKAPSASDLERGSPLDAHYRPPAVISPPAPPTPPPQDASLIPEDYDPLAPDLPVEPFPTPPPTPRPIQALPDLLETIETYPSVTASAPDIRAPSPSVAPPNAVEQRPAAAADNIPPPVADGGRDAGLAAVLAGAGLENVRVTPELAESFGQILRVVVSGVMDVLRARQQIKDEFRMRVTHFKVADNNPLKFSANIDDALHNLLVKRNEAYLAPVEAFDDAFEDLRNHQIALLTGMRVAFEFMLGEFDPDRLQKRFDRQTKKGSLLGMPAKLRYWELYRDRYEDIAKDPETSFRKLFGEAFAKAYEEQLERLKVRADNEKH